MEGRASVGGLGYPRIAELAEYLNPFKPLFRNVFGYQYAYFAFV
jgi:hypothetical protein